MIIATSVSKVFLREAKFNSYLNITSRFNPVVPFVEIFMAWNRAAHLMKNEATNGSLCFRWSFTDTPQPAVARKTAMFS
jgi:hypothetical protein